MIGRKRIKVLQVAPKLGIGGIERTVQLYTRHLDRRWFKLSVCGAIGGGVRAGQLADEGYPVFTADGDLRRFEQHVSEGRYDVVHFHRWPGDAKFVRAARTAGVHVIVDTNVFGRPLEGDDLIDVRCFIGKMVAMRYRKWAGLSREEFMETCRVIYTPIDLAELDRCRKQLDGLPSLTHRLGVAPNARLIGRVGRPSPTKWSSLCVQMMTHLVKEHPEVIYVALGAHDSFRRRVEQAGLSSYFIYLDPSPNFCDLIELYSALQVLCYSSINGEIMSGVISEAMACGVPVVVNSTPLRDNGQVEQVDHGENGFIANDPESFASAVSYLLSNPEVTRSMGRAARTKVENHYAAERTVACLGKIYVQTLLERGARLPRGVVAGTSSVEFDPAPREIMAFETEYGRRLRTCWGTPNYLHIWISEKMLMNYTVHSMLAGIKRRWMALRKEKGTGICSE